VDINDGGQVVGNYIDSNNVVHGLIRDSSGVMTSVDAPGASTQQGLGTTDVAINASGASAGSLRDQASAQHGFIRASNGTFTIIDALGSSSTNAFAINDTGEIAGAFTDVSGSHGFVRASDGTFTAFDPSGGTAHVGILIVKRITAGGVVVGFYTDSSFVFHGFLRAADGTNTVLDAPGAGTMLTTGTQVGDINAHGVIVGGIVTASGVGASTGHSFLRAADGTYTVFDPPEAGSHGSDAISINDSGVILGAYLDANLVRHGYLRDALGTFVTFDDPSAAQMPVSPTFLGTVPARINATGAIVGLYSDSTGGRHGFVRE
jgi:hypothetical protein